MIRIGVVGCGRWGPNHIRTFQANRRAKVVAFAEKDDERRKRTIEMFPGIRALTEGKDLISRNDIDAVVIATPTDTHPELVKAALACSKDVLCEKPLSMKAADSEDLVNLAAKTNRILMVGHTFIFNNGIQAMRRYIAEGDIGTPLYLYLKWTNLGPIRQDVNVVYDLASHDVYIANYLLASYPEHVVAKAAVYIQPGIEDVAFITLTYPTGVLAHIHVSWLDPKKVRQITVVGDKKMIVWDDLSSETIRIYNKGVEVGGNSYDNFGQYQLILKDGDVIIPKIKLREPLANQAEHFIDCVEKRCRPSASGEDGLAVVRILEKIQESANFNRKDFGN